MSSSADLLVDDVQVDIHGDQRGRIIGSCVAIFVITDIFVFLRLVSRKLARAGFWWDDVLAVIAMILSNVLCIIWFCELRNGYGRHIYIWPVQERLEKERKWRRDFFVFELFFHTAITICKFSVLAFYFRIFPFRQFRNVLFSVAALSLAYGISIDVTILLQCRPLHYQWDILDPNAKGSCVNFHDFFIGKGIANVCLNALIFLLIILGSIFTLAGFVIVVSIIWIIVVPDVTQADITWGSVNFGIWSTTEPHVAVICACIPSLRPLVTILRNGVFQHPMIQKSLKSTMASVLSSKPKWGEESTSSEIDGRFSRLDEMEDLRPLGHGADIRTGTRAMAMNRKEVADLPPEMVVPSTRIGVKTDVIVETSERLPYNDRLY